MSDNLTYSLGFHSGDDTSFYLAKGFRFTLLSIKCEVGDNVEE
jgi:hypothetical protein